MFSNVDELLSLKRSAVKLCSRASHDTRHVKYLFTYLLNHLLTYWSYVVSLSNQLAGIRIELYIHTAVLFSERSQIRVGSILVINVSDNRTPISTTGNLISTPVAPTMRTAAAIIFVVLPLVVK